MKKLSYIFYLVLVFCSCTVGYKGSKLSKKGIYECKSKVKLDAPVFRFNTYSNSTTVYIGSENYLKFYDLNSQQILEIHEDSYNYKCECIKEY